MPKYEVTDSTNPQIHKSTNPESEVLVRVEGVSKKFCKDLKRSLWYGLQDITSELFGLKKKEGLRKDEFWAVSEVSFELKRGECLGLIGHNGAGKSTLLKMLNGLIKPDKGRITMKGRIGALIELGAGFNPILTGRENVFNNGAVLGFSQKEIAAKYNDIVDFAELEEFMDTPVQNYSSGMKVRLGFAVAAQLEPDVLIIDEVLAVGDLGFRIKCLNKIGELLRKSAVIFVSHSMPMVARISSSAMLLHSGRSVIQTNDIGKIINSYNNEFGVSNYVVSGTGEVEIENVIVSNEVEFGKRLDLTFDIRQKLTGTKTVLIRALVWNMDQRPVMDIINSDFNSFRLNLNHEKIKIRIDVPNLTLTGGKHMISLHVVDEYQKVLCRIDNSCSFVMGHHLTTGGDFFLASEWSVFKGEY